MPVHTFQIDTDRDPGEILALLRKRLDDDSAIIHMDITAKDGSSVVMESSGAITITAGAGASITINVDDGQSVNIGDLVGGVPENDEPLELRPEVLPAGQLGRQQEKSGLDDGRQIVRRALGGVPDFEGFAASLRARADSLMAAVAANRGAELIKLHKDEEPMEVHRMLLEAAEADALATTCDRVGVGSYRTEALEEWERGTIMAAVADSLLNGQLQDGRGGRLLFDGKDAVVFQDGEEIRVPWSSSRWAHQHGRPGGVVTVVRPAMLVTMYGENDEPPTSRVYVSR